MASFQADASGYARLCLERGAEGSVLKGGLTLSGLAF